MADHNNSLESYVSEIKSRPTQVLTTFIQKTEKLLSDQTDYRVKLEAQFVQRCKQIDQKYGPFIVSAKMNIECQREKLDQSIKDLAKLEQDAMNETTKAHADWSEQDSAQAKLIEAEQLMLNHLRS